jgi:hypothetical protein
MKDLNDAVGGEENIWAITKIVIKLLKRNGN